MLLKGFCDFGQDDAQGLTRDEAALEYRNLKDNMEADLKELVDQEANDLNAFNDLKAAKTEDNIIILGSRCMFVLVSLSLTYVGQGRSTCNASRSLSVDLFASQRVPVGASNCPE